ncbi:mynd domain [Trichoderma arundinaceum]|uniref:MYND-type zinc finger protein samB n=1 Tax=Trichoderma arundinaceum TaxID=490622 RepID=A0A395NRU2_TRIAR|nr:mynd domain [Trichoderma arundinaceum]
MREVNFSIPNVNKASVGITTALYDRRALDCTSTLPLINSLNHLAYLTTSSARIRDILTVDGGIERLVCILKQGRNGDMMSIWKWNLAFQCVVNIGVRGTESVRTRVVEADMVPVIATILDNYIKVIDRCREKADELKQKQAHDHHRHKHHDHRHASKASPSSTGRSTLHDGDQRYVSRQESSSIVDASETLAGPSVISAGQSADTTSTNYSHLYANIDRSILTPNPPLLNSQGTDAPYVVTSRQETHHLAPGAPIADSNDAFARVLRDVDRLTSINTLGTTDLVTQPLSPTTPVPLLQLRPPTVRSATNLDATVSRSRRRPSIRHQNSTAESDDFNGDSMPSDEAPDTEMTGAAEIQSTVGIQDITMDDNETILTGDSLDLANPTASEAHQDAETFNIAHRTNLDGSIRDNMTHNPVAPVGLSPGRPTLVATTHPPTPSSAIPRYLLDRHLVPDAKLLSAMPREEDVLMSLQLLAYVSKYCCLRTYFQKSHLVPTLAVRKGDLDGDAEEDETPSVENERESDDEYLLEDDFNLFPLVEKFTVRYHSTDMQYWAGVVMRNLCRKDDTRGGIRQCAYYQCGKWEEFTRQFAKCRRCRRTKYCSKDCQKSAWAFHRHWCVAAAQ